MSPLANETINNNLSNTNSQNQSQFIFNEMDFLKHFYFCMDKKAANKTMVREMCEERMIDGQKKKIGWKVSANPEYGYPSVMSFRLFNIFLKYIAEYICKGKAIPSKLEFSINSILTELKIESGGEWYRKIKQAITQMKATTIECNYTRVKKIKNDNKHLQRRVVFSIFSNCGFKDDIGEDGKLIEKSFVILDPIMKHNLENNYFIKIDYKKMSELETTISQLLFQKLEYNFYIVKQQAKQGQELIYKKAYNDICNYWLLIKPHKQLSSAVRQLKRHLDELKRKNCLHEYKIYKGTHNEIIVNFTRLYKQEKLWNNNTKVKHLPPQSPKQAVHHKDLFEMDKVIEQYRVHHPRKYKRFYEKAKNETTTSGLTESTPLFFENAIKINLYESICKDENKK